MVCNCPVEIVINKYLSIYIYKDLSVNDKSNREYWFISYEACEVFGFDSLQQFLTIDTASKHIRKKLKLIFNKGF